MNVTMPPVLASYYAAKNSHDIEGMTACFAADAVVHDEGEELRGTAAIKDWITRTTEKYRVTVEVKEAKELGSEVAVTAMVSGNFDGSPLEMYYAFKLEGGRIAELKIDA